MNTAENNICPKCGGKIFMVEYSLTDPCHYDGVSEYACVNSLENKTCDYRIGRFCGKRLAPHEFEPPFCKGEAHLFRG